MGEGKSTNLRERIAAFFRSAISKTATSEITNFKPKQYRDFIVENLAFLVESDTGNGHHKYKSLKDSRREYSDSSVHAALTKIMKGQPAWRKGARYPNAVHFEKVLLEFINTSETFSGDNIPKNIFRDSYRESRQTYFALEKYLEKNESHAEYLCRRFLDMCSKRPSDKMGLLDEHYSGLIMFIVLEEYVENNSTHRIVTFSDTLKCNFTGEGERNIGSNKYSLFRINPENKPQISNIDIGGIVRERYTSPARISEKVAENFDVFQNRILGDLIEMAIDKLHPKIKEMHECFHEKFNSGDLFRVVLDVEKGAVFFNHAADGRFKIFSFCAVEPKVPIAENILRREIVGHYETSLLALAQAQLP